MTKAIPSIQKYMSTSPHTIGDEQTMAVAHRLLKEHKIRHLPVLRRGKLVGIVSDRDLHVIETLRDVDPQKVLVSDAMTQDPYQVGPEAPLDEVVATMAVHKYGSAIVTQHDKVVGIFTAVDACQALADLLQTRLSR